MDNDQKLSYIIQKVDNNTFKTDEDKKMVLEYLRYFINSALFTRQEDLDFLRSVYTLVKTNKINNAQGADNKDAIVSKLKQIYNTLPIVDLPYTQEVPDTTEEFEKIVDNETKKGIAWFILAIVLIMIMLGLAQ